MVYHPFERRAGRDHDVLIVGAGHAGAQTAISLRQHKFAGSIAIAGLENEPPYQRPPLSKEYFEGTKSFERLLIRPESYWRDNQIELRLGVRVDKIDPAKHVVTTADGDMLGYRKLVWAAGGRPRSLTCGGATLRGVHCVRTRSDVDAIQAHVVGAKNIVVVGAGYIGLEAAAVLTKLGKKVTVLETADRVLSRVTSAQMSRFLEAEHRKRGVDLRLGCRLRRLIGRSEHTSSDRVRGVELDNGEILSADLVIAGIGIVPAVEPLLEAGAQGVNGVNIDKFCQTSLTDVLAVGDCARHLNSFAGDEHIRLESVQNAHDQAAIAAKTIFGIPEPYRSIPWFWSNQFDLRLQTVGLVTRYQDVVVRGDPDTRAFSLIYLREGRVVAIDCINAAKDYAQAFGLLSANRAPSVDLLRDVSKPLKEIFLQAR